MYTVPKDTVIDQTVIKAAIEANELENPSRDELVDYYKGEHPILLRTKEGILKNNKLVINHAKYITDVNVGYLLGNPVEYQSTEMNDKGEPLIDLNPVIEQYKMQSINALDNELAKGASKIGKFYEYVYPLGNNVKSAKVDPRHCIFIYDDTVEHAEMAAIIYSGCTGVDAERKYHNVSVAYKDRIDEWNDRLEAIVKTTPHFFKLIPVIEYKNNDDEEGDYEQVISLINAYNILQSDRMNDKEQLVEAILVFYGFKLEKKDLAQLKIDRVLSIPKEDAKAEYLTKELNEESLDILRKVIEQDIHKISMTPNLADENFVGNSSGVAIRYKLIAFEQNTINKERYFVKGLKKRFELYNNYLITLGKSKEIPTYKVQAIFKRNLPQNDLETATIISTLKGMISDETLVGQMSFVEDAEKEVQWAREDSLDRAKALAEEFGTTTPSGESDKQTKDKKKDSTTKP